MKSSGGPGATTAAPTGPTPTLPGATPQMPRSAGAGQGSGPDGQGVMLGDNSWLASLATGDASSAPSSPPALRASPLAPLLLGALLLLLLVL